MSSNPEVFPSSPHDERNELPKSILRKWFIRGIVALCILAVGTTAYGEIEAQWYSSYMIDIAHGTTFDVGIMAALIAVVGTVFYLIWGAVGDTIRPKMGHRVFMILAGSLITAGFMILLILGTSYLWVIFFGGGLLAISSNMFHVNNRALIADLTPEDKRGKVNTALNVMSPLGSLVVWIPTAILLGVGGPSMDSYGTHVWMIGSGALIIAFTGIFTLILVREPPVPEKPGKWTREILSMFDGKELAKRRDFLKLFWAKLFLVGAQYAFMPFMLIILENIDFEVTTIAIGLPIVGVAVGVGVVLLGKYTDVAGRKKVSLLCLALAPIGGMILGFLGQDLFWLLVGFAVMMPFFMGLTIATDSWTLDLLPKEARGRFAGFLNLGSAIGKGIFVLIAGWVGTIYADVGVFIVAGIGLWISIPFFLRVPETYKPKSKSPASPN